MIQELLDRFHDIENMKDQIQAGHLTLEETPAGGSPWLRPLGGAAGVGVGPR